MPRINFIPTEHIPGTRFNQTDSEGGNVSGSADALSVAYGIAPDVKSINIPVAPKSMTLFPFQREGITLIQTMLKMHGGAILADDMGLGKTRQAAVVSHLMKQPNDSVLIVCPAGVRHQWEKEILMTSPLNNFYNLGPKSSKEYKKQWFDYENTTGHYAAVSYNMMEQALALRCPTTIVFDEPHNYLSGRGNTYIKALWNHIGKIRFKLALTGTPYTANPSSLWSLLNILFGMRFGKAREFDIRYCNGHQGTWGWNNKGATHMEELSKRLRYYMVRRMKSEVMKEMPAVTRVVRWVDGTSTATAALLNMEHTVGGMQKAQECTLKEKMSEVVATVEQAGKPCVVFTYLRAHADELSAKLNKAKQPSIAIHGEWEAGQRARMVQQAKENNLHVVTTYGASATGLDGLQKFSSNWVAHSINGVPAVTLQAIDRLNRIGQTEPVTATFIGMRDSVDELIIDKVINRLDVFGQILGRDKAATSLQDALRIHGVDDISELDAIFATLT